MTKRLSDKQIIKAAKQNNLGYREGGGSHFVITDPKDNSAMTCYHSREISPGVSCKIIKWFLQRGIILTFVVGSLYLFSAMGVF